MADEQEEKEKKKEAPQPKSGPNIIVVVAALLAIQAVVAFLVVNFALPKDTDARAAIEELQRPETPTQVNPINETIVLTVETTISVSGTQGANFARCKISLAADHTDKANARIQTGIVGIETQIRSKVNEFLSSLTLEELTNPNIRDHIRATLLSDINAVIAPANIGRLSSVYIEEFLVQ